jgi:hypothetical protein
MAAGLPTKRLALFVDIILNLYRKKEFVVVPQ